MKPEQAYEILERSDHPEMGANYLIADGKVYCVTFWAMGGVAARQMWKPGDVNFEWRYAVAAANPNTMFYAQADEQTKKAINNNERLQD